MAVYNVAGPGRLSTWTSRNKTLFNLTDITPNQFAQYNNDSAILYQTSSNMPYFSIDNTFKVNNVIAYIASSGKRGLLWVKLVTGDFATQLAGTLEFEYKMAQ